MYSRFFNKSKLASMKLNYQHGKYDKTINHIATVNSICLTYLILTGRTYKKSSSVETTPSPQNKP